jgi:hypothetical protein
MLPISARAVLLIRHGVPRDATCRQGSGKPRGRLPSGENRMDALTLATLLHELALLVLAIAALIRAIKK